MKKAVPLLTCNLIHSFNVNLERVQLLAPKVEYPYLMLLGEKDLIVDNNASRAWHGKTASKMKELKLMPGSFHELSKEPNNAIMFETLLKFTAKRETEGAKPFGVFNPKDVKFANVVPIWKKRNFWLL